MPKFQNEVQKFRHRGFEPNDGTAIVMIFGNDPEPMNIDGSAMNKVWDHDIEQVITVKDHIDMTSPVPLP